MSSRVGVASVHPGPERGRHMETRSKKDEIDLPGIAHWLSGWPANQRVVGSIPSQGTCLDCGPGPQEGVCKRQPHIDVSLLSFSLPSPL